MSLVNKILKEANNHGEFAKVLKIMSAWMEDSNLDMQIEDYVWLVKTFSQVPRFIYNGDLYRGFVLPAKKNPETILDNRTKGKPKSFSLSPVGVDKFLDAYSGSDDSVELIIKTTGKGLYIGALMNHVKEYYGLADDFQLTRTNTFGEVCYEAISTQEVIAVDPGPASYQVVSVKKSRPADPGKKKIFTQPEQEDLDNLDEISTPTVSEIEPLTHDYVRPHEKEQKKKKAEREKGYREEGRYDGLY